MSPFKSREQIAKFAELVKEGKMTKETFHEWLQATPSVKNLPKRVEPKSRSTSIQAVKTIKTTKVLK